MGHILFHHPPKLFVATFGDGSARRRSGCMLIPAAPRIVFLSRLPTSTVILVHQLLFLNSV
jgi:hypothetical protein